jgi:hypothetical protein
VRLLEKLRKRDVHNKPPKDTDIIMLGRLGYCTTTRGMPPTQYAAAQLIKTLLETRCGNMPITSAMEGALRVQGVVITHRSDGAGLTQVLGSAIEKGMLLDLNAIIPKVTLLGNSVPNTPPVSDPVTPAKKRARQEVDPTELPEVLVVKDSALAIKKEKM